LDDFLLLAAAQKNCDGKQVGQGKVTNQHGWSLWQLTGRDEERANP
jgi:hypothetical protein